MAHHHSRRDFLNTTSATVGAVSILGLADIASLAQATASQKDGYEVSEALPDKFPSQADEDVRAVVGASHVQFDKVKKIVSNRPALAKASWDWGFGDWESALGAASHMGRHDIAEFLIAHGARPNLFTHAMLGNLEVVKAAVEAVPGIQRIHGPHGITLAQHARNGQRGRGNSEEGKQKAKAVADYLDSLGDADPVEKGKPLTDEQKKTYIGQYAFGPNPNDTLIVELNRRNDLSLKRGDGVPRRLLMVESHTFAPSGANAVRIQFAVEGGRASRVTIHDPIPLLTASRTS